MKLTCFLTPYWVRTSIIAIKYISRLSALKKIKNTVNFLKLELCDLNITFNAWNGIHINLVNNFFILRTSW